MKLYVGLDISQSMTHLCVVDSLLLAVRRVSRHLQGNAEGVRAVTSHVLIPLLGRQPEGESEQAPDSEPEAGIAGADNAQK